MKKIKLFLLILSFITSLAHAENADSDVMNDFLQVRQIPDSNSELSNYFNRGLIADTIFAIINPLANCPRCETAINPVINSLKSVRPDIPVVFIAVCTDSVAAKKYIDKYHFMADNVLYDTDQSYKKFLSFSPGYLHIPYVLKVCPKSGEMITGIEAEYNNFDIINALCLKNTPDIKKSFSLSKEFDGVYKPSGKQLGYVGRMALMMPDSICLSETDYMPEYYKGKLFVNDKLNECVEYFKLNNDGQPTLDFVKEIRTDSAQNHSFIQIPNSTLSEVKKLLRVMPMTPKMINDSTLAISYSLPNVWNYNDSAVAYMNKACFLKLNPDSITRGNLVPFLTEDDENFFYPHYYLFPFNGDIAIGCERCTWPMEYEKEEYCDNPMMNPFDNQFYSFQQPIIAVFDNRTGSIKRRLGQLPSLSKQSLTGYYFAMPKADSYGGATIISDGFSGNISIYSGNDSIAYKEVSAFSIPDNEVPLPDADLFYSYDCASPFVGIFNRNIEDIKLSADNSIYCLIRYGKHGSKKKDDRYSVVMIAPDCNCSEERLFPVPEASNYYYGLGREKDGSIMPFILSKDNNMESWQMSMYGF